MELTIRIAIIGAGPAGLAQAKQALDTFTSERYTKRAGSNSKRLEIVVFEARDDIGGVWILNEDVSPPVVTFDLNGDAAHLQPAEGENPTPMYPGLRTNLPKSIMTYRGTTWPEEVPEFPRPRQVHKYLSDYAASNGLLQYIRFKTMVTAVKLNEAATTGPKCEDSKQRRWRVCCSPVEDEDTHLSEDFDFVSVCNGHYTQPWVPKVSGLSNFKGRLLHSRWFRRGSDFRGSSVLVVGSFASGYDVARMIASQNYESESGQLTPGERAHHTKVYQSSTKGDVRGVHEQPWDRYIDARPVIDHVEPPTAGNSNGTIHFKDGSSISDVDVIIYATGYYLSYPFLKAADRPWNDPAFRVVDGVISPSEAPPVEQGGLRDLSVSALDDLFLFLKRDRTIAFLGLPFSIIPFPFFETQAHLTSLTWAGLLPDLPDVFSPPPNTPSVKEPSSGPPTPEEDQAELSECKPPIHVRTTQTIRKGLAFTPEYDFVYQDYILSLTRDVDGGEAEGWGRVEDWRREIRADKERRYRSLGY